MNPSSSSQNPVLTANEKLGPRGSPHSSTLIPDCAPCGKIRHPGAYSIGSSLFEGLRAADGALQARGGIEEIVRSRRQHQIKGNGSARAVRVGPANIVNGDCRSCQLHPRWCIQRVPPRPQSRIISATTSGWSPKPFSRSAETGKIGRVSTAFCACQRF